MNENTEGQYIWLYCHLCGLLDVEQDLTPHPIKFDEKSVICPWLDAMGAFAKFGESSDLLKVNNKTPIEKSASLTDRK